MVFFQFRDNLKNIGFGVIYIVTFSFFLRESGLWVRVRICISMTLYRVSKVSFLNV